jgi:chemotaxis protein MotA
MDVATLIGVFCGFFCILVAIVGGGTLAVFVHIPSMLIVVGGTLSATFIHFSLGQVLKILPVVKKTLFCKLPTNHALMQDMVNYSAVSRRDGALALEQQTADVQDPFLLKSLRLVIDGQETEEIEDQLSTEVRYLQERHQQGKKILDFMGAAAPAFGMIGTLIGLINMLQNLSNPAGLGQGMAVALITTFYGALLANLVFIPLAGKLGIRSKQETLMREMITQGVIGIARGESPSAVRERMQVLVSAKNRRELTADAGAQQAKVA